MKTLYQNASLGGILKHFSNWKRCTCEGSGEILVAKKMNSEEFDKVKDSVKNYYGKILKTSDDIQSNASKIDEYNGMTSSVKSALKLIHEEVSNK